MSRRTQATIEEFDDDTDLPLPSRPLLDPGSKGALIESVDSDADSDDDDDDDTGGNNISRPAFTAGPASPSQLPPSFGATPPGARNTITDLTPYKKWTCIYPIYIDAKRRYGTGSRRVPREKAIWWPLSKDIADATTRLGLGTLHEVQKNHPSDWDNPGRVRVQWKRDGRLVNPRIRTKKQLLEAIAFYIQSVKPELIPKPPFTTSPTEAETAPPSASAGKQPPPKSKPKQRSKANEKDKPTRQVSRKRLPQPPQPHAPLASSVSAYSPALPSGVLVETIKAGMSAAAAENAAAPQSAGKGKRKVVRVRG